MKNTCTKIALILSCIFFATSAYAAPTEDPALTNTSCNIDDETFDQIIAEVKKKNSDIINSLIDCLKLNRKLMLRAALIDPKQFQYASEILREDESFVYRVIEINPEILKFASDKLRSDPIFMENATYLSRDALQYADPKLLDNKLFIKNMIRIDSRNYMFASDRLKEIPEFAASAFKDNGLLLANAPTKIKSDKALVKIAVTSNAAALEFADDALKQDKNLKKLATHKSAIKSQEDLSKFLQKNYLNDSGKKHVGTVIDNRMKHFSANKIIDRNYVTKWQRSFAANDKSDDVHLITADIRNYPIPWKKDFKKFPLLIAKIEKFFLNHQVDRNTSDSLSTTYFWKVKKVPQTVVFNLYLLRDSKDIELGPKFADVTSLTAIAQKQGEEWHLSVVEVIFDSEIKVDPTYENGHKKFNLWDLYEVDKSDKNPKIIFKVEDKFREYFQVFEEANNGKYQMAYEIDALKDAAAAEKEGEKEDVKPEEF